MTLFYMGKGPRLASGRAARRRWRGGGVFLTGDALAAISMPAIAGFKPAILQKPCNRLKKAGPDPKIRAPGIEREDKMFAVIKTGGKQYRVAAEDKLKVEKVAGEPGDIIQFGEVLVVGGDTVTLGTPTVAGASVAAEVLDQGRGPKVIAFKKRRRKNSRRKRGHRQELTLVRITEILTDGAQPTKAARGNARPPAEPAAEAAAEAAAPA
jgi:large subunit ribosomal protein L21